MRSVFGIIAIALAGPLLSAKGQEPTHPKGLSDPYESLVMRYYDYFEGNQLDSAELALQEALALFPEKESNFALHGNLAELLVSRGDTLGAVAQLSEALAAQPLVTQLRSRRAALYEELGRYNDALLDLDLLIQQQPTWEIPLYNRARVRSKLGLYNGAASDLGRILEINPEAYLPRVALAEAHNKAGDPLLAEKLLTQLIEKYPKIPNAYRALGWLLLGQDRKAEALDMVRHVIQELKMGSAEDYLLRGAIWKRYGETQQAEADLEKARQKGATDKDLLERNL